MAHLRGNDFSRPDNHALRPEFRLSTFRSTGRRLRDLAKALTSPFPQPLHAYRAIFTWVASNIQYVIKPGEKYYEYQHPVEVYNSGVARCVGFSALFKYMCNCSGLPCRMVGGPVHGSEQHELHCWVMVNLPQVGGTRYFDPTFAADMDGDDYFVMGRDEFARTHEYGFDLASKTSNDLDW